MCAPAKEENHPSLSFKPAAPLSALMLPLHSELQSETVTLGSPLRADEWMATAVDCLEFLPDRLVVELSRGLLGYAADLPQCKRLMYEVLAQHYGHAQQTPLLNNHVFDIHSGISELLGTMGSSSGNFCGDACFGGGSSNPTSLLLCVIS